MVSSSFTPSRNVVHIDGFEVVEVLAVLKSPSVRQLRFLVCRICEPSVFNGLKVFFLCSSCCISCLPMVVLPLFWSMTFSFLTSFYDVQWICDDVNSILDFLCLFRLGHQTLTTQAVNCPFFGIS